MSQKPKIQYVGQFYIHGSEARQLELQEKKKQAKSKLPLERLRKIEVVYLDPVAIFGIVTALVMLTVMILGVLQIRQDWQDYRAMSNYVSRLNSSSSNAEGSYLVGKATGVAFDSGFRSGIIGLEGYVCHSGYGAYVYYTSALFLSHKGKNRPGNINRSEEINIELLSCLGFLGEFNCTRNTKAGTVDEDIYFSLSRNYLLHS